MIRVALIRFVSVVRNWISSYGDIGCLKARSLLKRFRRTEIIAKFII